MKTKISKRLGLCVTIFCFAIAIKANAQEEGSSLNEYLDVNQNSELNLEEDKTLIFENETRVTKHDTVSSRPVIKSPAKSKPSERIKSTDSKEERDALSFNFLYYIIQKFKYSDLVDQ